MLVFLTWSGDRSNAVASALRDCLPLICNSFRPWKSDVDIAKGAPWFPEVTGKLAEAGAGVLCLTPENQDERWVLFEAGAVAKAVPDRALAIPYLYGMKAGELRPPLKELQAVTNAQDEGENWQMVQSLYKALADKEKTIDKDELRSAFEMTWKAKLKDRLDKVPAGPAAPPAATRPDSSAESLVLLRELVERDRERAKREQRQRATEALSRGIAETITARDAAEALAASLPPDVILTVEEFERMEPQQKQLYAKMLAAYVKAQAGRAAAVAAARPAQPVVTPDQPDAGDALLPYPPPPKN